MGAELVDIKDPTAVAFFVSDLCQEADLVYRFAYTLTLSEVAAEKLVQDTFKAIVGQVAKFLEMTPQAVRLELLKVAWGQFQDWSEKFKETETPMLKFLSKLNKDARIVLILIDILGLSKQEAQDVLQLKEIEILRFLAESRLALFRNSN